MFKELISLISNSILTVERLIYANFDSSSFKQEVLQAPTNELIHQSSHSTDALLVIAQGGRTHLCFSPICFQLTVYLHRQSLGHRPASLPFRLMCQLCLPPQMENLLRLPALQTAY